MAAYAVLAALSLGSLSSGVLLTVPSALDNLFPKVGLKNPHVGDFIKPRKGNPAVGALLSQGTLNLGSQTTSASIENAVKLKNTSTAPLQLTVSIQDAPGVTAAFSTGRSTTSVSPGHLASVTLQTDPAVAGPIDGKLKIDLNSNLHAESLFVTLQGEQAPLQPGAVTAAPRAGGAVALSWPASPSSGVAGYAVFRRQAGGAWQRLPGGLVPASGIVDRVGTDGQAYAYRVEAAAANVPGELLSPPGGVGTVTTDASAPAAPVAVTAPDVINLENHATAPYTIDLPADSLPTDVVTLWLTDISGKTISVQTSGGAPTQTIDVDTTQLADGPIAAAVTMTDAIGNAQTSAEPAAATTKDTVAPDAPQAVFAPDVNMDSSSAAPVYVKVADPQDGDQVKAMFTDAKGVTAANRVPVDPDGTTRVPVDVDQLVDGPLTVQAWVIDKAGNTSQPTPADELVTKDVVPPAAPFKLTVPGGPSNPSGYVNAATESDATVVAAFDQPTDPTDRIVLTVGGIRFYRQGGDDKVRIGSIDLSDQEDGPIPLSITITDAVGNVTEQSTTVTKDTVAPAGPASFIAPEGANNPVGYVNAATQSAAVFAAEFPEGTDPGDTISVSVNEQVDLGLRAGGGTEFTWQGDVSALPDGPLDLNGTITDAAGNSTDFGGDATKDTVPPATPESAHVASCPPDTIRPDRAEDVRVLVAFGQETDPSDTITVTLTDSDGLTATASAPGGHRFVMVSGLDASAFAAGDVGVGVTVTDVAGNSVQFTGTTAVKLGHHPGD